MPVTGTPVFGRAMLGHWWLDDDAVYLNHGTVGVTPRRVLATQQALREQIERHPARFMLRELMSLDPAPPAEAPRLRAAVARVAAFLGARAGDLVFVDNATSGVNAVLRSLKLQAGDEIVLFEHAYGAVERTARHIAQAAGAQVVRVAMAMPPRDPAQCLAALEAGLGPRTRLAIIDHVTSETALVLPLAALAALCRDRGVPVLVDGAHAPAAIALDIPALGVDWYVGNLHKWAFAPRSCGVLWAAPERQAGLHPSVISWGLDVGWLQEFDWTGTRDPTPFLCAPDGMAFIDEVLGGAAAMQAHNHALAWRAALRLADRWGQAWTTPESMIGCMASIPLPDRLGSSAAQAMQLKDWLLFARRIEIPVMARGDRLWVRLSAQVYNDDDDVERLAAAIDAYAAR